MTRASQSPGRGRGDGGAGFSLFELVVVIVIVAMMAGIAIPRFAESNARYRLDAVERRVLADAGLVEERARATGVAHEIEFDDAGETYTTYAGTGAGRAALAAVRLGGEPYRAQIDAVSINGGGKTLAYDGRGRARSAASVTVRVGATTRVIALAPEPPVGTVEETPVEAEEEGKGVLDLLDLPPKLISGLLG